MSHVGNRLGLPGEFEVDVPESAMGAALKGVREGSELDNCVGRQTVELHEIA
ncbi:MAG TPA: hypothetical protein VGO48_13440 [Conexibacter sp.]|nr:hypothetical protein [Conexibacter sp.]